MARIKQEQAIAVAGSAAVLAAMAANADFTNRVTAGTADAGFTEFSASVSFQDADGNECTLIAYWFHADDEVDSAESLDQLTWGNPDEYEVV